MNSKKIVKTIMALRGHTCDSLGKKLGLKTSSGVSERLRGTADMRVDTLVKFLEAMDCELVVRSKLGDKSSWVVGLEESEEE